MANVKMELTFELRFTDEDADDDAVPVEHRVTKEVTGLTNVQALNKRSIADATTIILWDANDFAIPASFSYFFAWADRELQFEFTAGEGEANEELCVHRQAANLPLCLGPDDTFRGHGASDALGGTADVFDKIRVKNASGAAAKLYYLFVE